MPAEASGRILAATRDEVFADGYVQAEEPPIIKYQDPERKGVCSTGYFWGFYNPVKNLRYFAWRTGRGTGCLQSIVPAGFKGLIQCDGYNTYNAFTKQRAASAPLPLAGCMAHVRRKFLEAKAEGEDSAWFLLQIQNLYRIESRLRDCRAGPGIIRRERQTHSLPVLQQIKTRLDDLSARRNHLPQSLTGLAITYALGPWEKLLAPPRTAGCQSTIIWRKIPSAPPPSAKRTGCSLATPKAATAPPRSTP